MKFILITFVSFISVIFCTFLVQIQTLLLSFINILFYRNAFHQYISCLLKMISNSIDFPTLLSQLNFKVPTRNTRFIPSPFFFNSFQLSPKLIIYLLHLFLDWCGWQKKISLRSTSLKLFSIKSILFYYNILLQYYVIVVKIK